MNDICIPIPRLQEQQAAEMEVKISGEKMRFNFRVEVFPWQDDQEMEIEPRISSLKSNIENYDKSWELVQIYNPRPNAKFIQVLFRQRILN